MTWKMLHSHHFTRFHCTRALCINSIPRDMGECVCLENLQRSEFFHCASITETPVLNNAILIQYIKSWNFTKNSSKYMAVSAVKQRFDKASAESSNFLKNQRAH